MKMNHPDNDSSQFEFAGESVSDTVLSGVVLVLLVAIILQYTLLPTSVVYALITLVYLLIVPLLVLYNDTIEVNSTYTKLYLVFAALVYLRLLFEPSLGNLARLGVLFTFTTANIFVIPSLLPLRQFLSVTARVSAPLVVVGLFPYLGLPVQFGFVDLSLWGARIYWYESLNPITSVFSNPNQLGGLALVGGLAALHECFENRTRTAGALLLVNSAGLLLTNWRTGWIIYTLSVGLYLVYFLKGRQYLTVAIGGSLICITAAILMAFDVLPGPSVLSDLSFGNRRPRWVANVRAFLDQPLWGYGFTGITDFEGGAGNPHNSYLRIFTGFGIIGGILYLLIVVGTAIGSARRAVSYRDATLAILLTGFCILQIFNQLSFIGISMRSTFIAIMIGYYITGAGQYKE